MRMSQLLKLCSIVLLCSLFISGRRQGRLYTDGGNRLVGIEAHNGRYRLYRNGLPYYIQGANITDGRCLRALKEAGANSVRIYNTSHAQEILDSAYKLGLTVTVGLQMGYADKDIDYNDPVAVKAQLEQLKAEVQKYKNHPALLMWGVGNETTLYMEDKLSRFFDHVRVSRAINAVARMIHQTDPHHPTVMMVQGGSSNRINAMVCDEVDLIAYNSFEPVRDQLEKSSWEGPYLISEFGARGYWKCGQTEWYRYIEPTSREKIQFIEQQYRHFRADTVDCLGCYAFLWGQKQEYTSTWFSLYTPQGEPTALTDALQALWAGKAVQQNTAIAGVRIDNKPDAANIYLQAGKPYTAGAVVTAPLQNDAVLHWEIQTDRSGYLNDGDDPLRQVMMTDSFVLPAKRLSGKYEFRFTAPAVKGPFRLFLYLKAGTGNIATANACFYVYE